MLDTLLPTEMKDVAVEENSKKRKFVDSDTT